jgi:hypothetical protein
VSVDPGVPDGPVETGVPMCGTCTRTADCAVPLRCLSNLCVPGGQPEACTVLDASEATPPDILEVPEFLDPGPAEIPVVPDPGDETSDLAADIPPTEATCSDKCLDPGARQCNGNTIVACEDGDGDGCVEWVPYPTCPAGTACKDGECACTPDCTGKSCGDDGCGGSCGACDPATPLCLDGACVQCLADADCADADACTWDACLPGNLCTHAPVDCDDHDPCTKDACDPTSGCTHFPDAGPEVCGDGADNDCDGKTDETEDCMLSIAPAKAGLSVNDATLVSVTDGFWVCWKESTGAGESRDIYCRKYSPSGSAGKVFKVSGDAALYRAHPCVASTSDGLVVAWMESTQTKTPEKSDVYARAFDSDGGSKGDPVQIDQGLDGVNHIQCAPTSNGVLVGYHGLVNTSPDVSEPVKVYVRALGYDAKPQASQTLIGEGEYPALAWVGGGKGVVAFVNDCQPDDTGQCVYYRFVTDKGTTSGIAVKASTTPVESDMYPALAATLSSFMVAWRQDATHGKDLRVRRFDSSGKAGTELSLGNAMNASVNGPTATQLADGRFLVAWWHHDDGVRVNVLDSAFTTPGKEIVLTDAGDGWDPRTAEIGTGTALVLFEDKGFVGWFVNF